MEEQLGEGSSVQQPPLARHKPMGMWPRQTLLSHSHICRNPWEAWGELAWCWLRGRGKEAKHELGLPGTQRCQVTLSVEVVLPPSLLF